jgi:hypothetical protein
MTDYVLGLAFGLTMAVVGSFLVRRFLIAAAAEQAEADRIYQRAVDEASRKAANDAHAGPSGGQEQPPSGK